MKKSQIKNVRPIQANLIGQRGALKAVSIWLQDDQCAEQ